VTARFLELPSGDHVRVVEAGAESAPPVVLLHGWGGSAYSYRHLLPLLAGGTMRAIAPDLRGHGLSAKPLDSGLYTSAAMVGQVVGVLDALNLTSAVFVGQSMGAAIALDIALQDPARARAVVLAAPVGLTAIRRISVARMLRAAQWMPGHVPRWGISLLLRRLYGTLRTYDERDVDEYWAPAQFTDFVRALFLLVNAFDWRRRAPERLLAFGDRVHVILAEHDRLVALSRALLRTQALPRSAVTIVRGAGHLVAEEAPETIAAVIGDMVQRTEGQKSEVRRHSTRTSG